MYTRQLLDFVQSPYFTEETVRKEQGIIGQEIRMYDDAPDWRVQFNLLAALYQNHPVRIDIAGTVESIAPVSYTHLAAGGAVYQTVHAGRGGSRHRLLHPGDEMCIRDRCGPLSDNGHSTDLQSFLPHPLPISSKLPWL